MGDRALSAVRLSAGAVALGTAAFTVVTDQRGMWSPASAGLALLLWSVVLLIAARIGSRTFLAGAEPEPESGSEFNGFPTDDYLRWLERAEHVVRIQDSFTDVLADERHRDRVLSAFRRLIEDRGGDVEIVLLETQSSEIGPRAEALGDALQAPRYEERVETNLRVLYQFRKSLSDMGRERFRVRLISFLPGVTCYQIDDRVLTTVFPFHRRADEAPQSWVAEDSRIGRIVGETFRYFRDSVGKDFDERMLLAMDLGGDSRPLRYVGPDRDDAVYVVTTDPSVTGYATEGHPVDVVLPDEDGDRTRQRYRARLVDAGTECFAAVEDAVRGKYGDRLSGERVLALSPA